MGGGISRRKFVHSVLGAGAVISAQSALAQSKRQAGERRTGHLAPHPERIAWAATPFPLKQVRLLSGPFQQQMEINTRYLHELPNDRLLHTFRLTAGLPSSAHPFGGWEDPKGELRGHLSGGHYLSACALTVANTGDTALKKKADELVAELAKCQKKNGGGYLSAFPTEEFDRLRAGKNVWAPFYTYHKIMAGLLDMATFAGNDPALEMAEGMAAWAARWAKALTDSQLQRILNVEYGGMNEALYNLYALTGREEYLALGDRFSHRDFFEPLEERRDELKGLHVNTHIPQVIGAARRYELTGESRYRDIADYFWSEVTSRRSYSTGNTSNFEHWNSAPDELATELGPDTAECCCAYNMLKLTRHLFAWTGGASLMDYYERTLVNSRLGTQDPDGLKMYYYPLAAGFWKTYGTAFDSFWCCTGTGMEEFAKFADTIYYHDAENLYVNLFIASELDWPEKRLRLRQETKFPEEEGTVLTFAAERPVKLALNLRAPEWAYDLDVKLNGAPQNLFSAPGTFLAIERTWQPGDKLEIGFKMHLTTEPIPGDPTLQAVLYGPLVLAGELGGEGLTREMIVGPYGPRGKPAVAPIIGIPAGHSPRWVEPVKGEPLKFQTLDQETTTRLIPLHQIAKERYVVYWKVNSANI
jgi:uncharacterized protein